MRLAICSAVSPGDDGQGVDADLLAQNSELLHGGRAAGVERGHQDAFSLALGEAFGEFGGGGGFTACLKADHQDGRRRAVDLELACLGAVAG